MRAGLLVLAVFACGPRAATTPRPVERDLDQRAEPVATEPAVKPDEQRVVAPPGKGLRSGTIERAQLVAVIDAGPAMFLRQVEVAPRRSGEKFVGWQLVQLIDHTGPLHDVDLVPGDVLLAVNGRPVSRPDELYALWNSLRTANEVTARLWRGDQKLELKFAVQPPVP
jgi:S1-C subfamily serine protease